MLLLCQSGRIFIKSRISTLLKIRLLSPFKSYWVTQKLPHIYTSNHANFPIRIRKIPLQICGNFWVTQYHDQIEKEINFCPTVHG